MKLTPTQEEVVKLMKDGWELGRSDKYPNDGHSWKLQKGGIGKGGEVKRLNGRSCQNLWDKKVIQPKGSYGVRTQPFILVVE